MCFHQPLFKLIKDESSCSGWRNFLGNVSGILSALFVWPVKLISSLFSDDMREISQSLMMGKH